ncbi:MAG: hypothetical protein WAT78_05070 [Rhizobiaceae bacterium]
MNFFHFEHRSERIAGLGRFSQRLLRNGAAVLLVLMAALSIGMAGYSGFEGMSATDAFVNAAMILSGMGPVDPLRTEGGKIFAGVYAIFSGVAFIAISALMLAPVLHRVLHRFHMDDDEEGTQS